MQPRSGCGRPVLAPTRLNVCSYHVRKVHAHAQRPVASIVLEAVAAKEEGDEGDVRRVHSLKAEARRGTVEVSISDEVLDGLQHLLQQATLGEASLKHFCFFPARKQSASRGSPAAVAASSNPLMKGR